MISRFLGFFILLSKIIIILSECGLNFNDKDDLRIVGGKEALPYSWPSMARFFSPYDGNLTLGKGLCGGTIIDRETIISAAHCFPLFNENLTLEENFRVKVGIHSVYEGDLLEIKSIIIVS